MCGIIGTTNLNIHESLIKNSLSSIKNRGLDSSNYIKTSLAILGANRLAIRNSSNIYNQPFSINKKHIVYNGEIWNNSLENDTQFILNSSEPIKNIDGMYALCIVDEEKESITLSRDYIGEIPLYYLIHENNLYFASEIKAIQYMIPVDVSNIKLFPPGSIGIWKNNNLEISTWYSMPNSEILDNKETIISNFRKLLEESVSKRLDNKLKPTIMLSGGIDSTIIAFLLKQHYDDLEAFTIHLGDSNKNIKTNDLYFSREVAKHLKIKLNEIIISEKDVYDNLESSIYTIEDQSWTQLSSGIPHCIMAKHINKSNYKIVFGGGGSDELFASYPSQKRWQWKDDQYDKARRNLILNLHKNNVIRENKCMLSQHVELRSPYLDRKFVEYAINIPIKYRYENKRMKPILRYAFPEIPDHILWREKICEGEGVGIENLVKSLKLDIISIYNRLFSCK